MHVSVGRRSVCHLSPGNGPSNARAILAVFCRRGWQLSLPSLVAGAILNRRLMGIYGWEQRLRLAPISACAIPTVLHLSCTICLFWLLPTLNSFEEHQRNVFGDDADRQIVNLHDQRRHRHWNTRKFNTNGVRGSNSVAATSPSTAVSISCAGSSTTVDRLHWRSSFVTFLGYIRRQ